MPKIEAPTDHDDDDDAAGTTLLLLLLLLLDMFLLACRCCYCCTVSRRCSYCFCYVRQLSLNSSGGTAAYSGAATAVGALLFAVATAVKFVSLLPAIACSFCLPIFFVVLRFCCALVSHCHASPTKKNFAE